MCNSLAAFSFAVTVLFSGVGAAQEKAPERDGAQIIDELVDLLDHEDPTTALVALDALADFRKSRINQIRFRAQIALNHFNEEAWDWLRENARFTHPATTSRKHPGLWDSRPQTNFAIDFVDSDIDPAKLIYLRAIGLTSVAFVNMPQLEDKHLAYLVDQPNLVSLTLEKTGVRGSGFKRVDIPSVQSIFLTGSPITDIGLLTLKKPQFPNLQQIVVVDTEVTENARIGYRNENPILVRRKRD